MTLIAPRAATSLENEAVIVTTISTARTSTLTLYEERTVLRIGGREVLELAMRTPADSSGKGSHD